MYSGAPGAKVPLAGAVGASLVARGSAWASASTRSRVRPRTRRRSSGDNPRSRRSDSSSTFHSTVSAAMSQLPLDRIHRKHHQAHVLRLRLLEPLFREAARGAWRAWMRHPIETRTERRVWQERRFDAEISLRTRSRPRLDHERFPMARDRNRRQLVEREATIKLRAASGYFARFARLFRDDPYQPVKGLFDLLLALTLLRHRVGVLPIGHAPSEALEQLFAGIVAGGSAAGRCVGGGLEQRAIVRLRHVILVHVHGAPKPHRFELRGVVVVYRKRVRRNVLRQSSRDEKLARRQVGTHLRRQVIRLAKRLPLACDSGFDRGTVHDLQRQAGKEYVMRQMMNVVAQLVR